MPTGAIVLFVVAAAFPLTAGARVDDERAVERARYRFVIGNTKPFDEVYPRAIFEKRVAREMAEERALHDAFGLTVTPALLAQEYDRIEGSTKAPEQWEAIKKALGGDRRLIEDVFCRPILVDRALRARFAFDPKIHAAPHQQAREARSALVAGKMPPGANVVRLARKASRPATTEQLLGGAKADSSTPRLLSPRPDRAPDEPIAPDPEVAAVLEKELQRPGDVTTILEERDRFQVLRLRTITPDSWEVEMATFPKVDFDGWLARQIRRPSARR